MFDYKPGQEAKAKIFGGWRPVVVEDVASTDTWVRVAYTFKGQDRLATIYDPRLIEPCRKKSKPSTSHAQLSFD